ncbi:5834_t:CDS:2, partial [Rhizophagus irregularis]
FVAQWNLLKMTFEMQYNLVGDVNNHYDRGHYGIMINKNQTLLALYNRYSGSVDIYLMETGIHVSRYVAENYIPVEFVTSKDGSEGLLIFNDDYRQYRFLDPFHPSEEVDISTCVIENPKNILITKSNKTLYIKENNVWVTDGLTLPTLPANLENFDNDFSKFDKELILSIINDTVEFSKYGSKILQMAINEISSVGNSNEMCKYAIQLVFDKIIELIETENYHYMALLPIISLKLPELCDHHYSSLVMKYILFTSILLDPYCLSVKNSTTSLYAYYDMPVDEVRKLINAIDDHRTEFHSLPFISKRLRELRNTKIHEIGVAVLNVSQIDAIAELEIEDSIYSQTYHVLTFDAEEQNPRKN